jgi:hypothetical protein
LKNSFRGRESGAELLVRYEVINIPPQLQYLQTKMQILPPFPLDDALAIGADVEKRQKLYDEKLGVGQAIAVDVRKIILIDLFINIRKFNCFC